MRTWSFWKYDARFHSNLRIRRCKIAKNIARCRIARPAVISIAWFCIKRFLYCFSKECVDLPATHDIAKFVHRCLALMTPVLTAVLFRRIRQVERRFSFFFSLHRSRWLFLRNPNNKIKPKVSWRVFSKRQSGPASSRIPDRPNLNFDRSRMVLRQECFGMQSLPQWVQKTNWQAVRETQESIDARAREKKPVDMVTFPATLDAESPRDWPKTTVWPWCKRDDEILRCRIVRFWYSVVTY